MSPRPRREADARAEAGAPPPRPCSVLRPPAEPARPTLAGTSKIALLAPAAAAAPLAPPRRVGWPSGLRRARAAAAAHAPRSGVQRQRGKSRDRDDLGRQRARYIASSRTCTDVHFQRTTTLDATQARCLNRTHQRKRRLVRCTYMQLCGVLCQSSSSSASYSWFVVGTRSLLANASRELSRAAAHASAPRWKQHSMAEMTDTRIAFSSRTFGPCKSKLKLGAGATGMRCTPQPRAAQTCLACCFNCAAG